MWINIIYSIKEAYVKYEIVENKNVKENHFSIVWKRVFM